MTTIDPNDLGAIEKSITDAAAQTRTIWFGLITFGLYLVVAVASISDRTLLLELPMKLPLLNIDLSFVGFFVVAPVTFLIFHLYTVVQLGTLSDKVTSYNEALRLFVPVMADRRRMRVRLDPFIFVQLLARIREVPGDVTMILLRAMVAITVAIGPILLLLQIQCTFLPYHLSSVTWFHRVIVFIDLILICSFWPAIRHGANPAILPPFRRHWIMYSCSTLAIMFSGLVATFPGERIASFIPPNELSKMFFGGDVDHISGRPRSLFSNVIVFPGQTLTGNGAQTFSLRGRDFRGAVFLGSDLRKADFSHANLEAAFLQAANLDGAELQGASLNNAQLQGASLNNAQLQGASLNDAQLQGASLKGAELRGASLKGAQLQGARLEPAQLEGALLDGAKF